jgi:hypothetical protein
MWFARFSSLDRSSPGGFWDFGTGWTGGGFAEFVRGRFLGVIVEQRMVWFVSLGFYM